MTAQAQTIATTEPVQEYASGLLDIIGRAARDPSVDIDKMERLLAMQERVLERQAKADFTAAKLAMQPELPVITMKGRIVIHDKNDKSKVLQETPFPRFEDIHEAVMPILQRHGFDLKFKNTTSETGKPVVTTILQHIGGHSDETEFELPMDTSGSKNNVQAVGSSTSYGKRYGTVAILNLRVHGEDDDAVEAGKPAAINDNQLKEILALLDEAEADKAKFCQLYGINSVPELPVARFAEAVEKINQKIRSAANAHS